MEKETVRKQFLSRRRQLDLSRYRNLSLKVQEQLLSSESFKNAQSVALYSSINNEVATDRIFFVARSLGKKVCYPKVDGNELAFCEVDALTALIPGAFGVAEPKESKVVLLSEIELLVVPGVAFDLKGHRLGYGRGFYDRQLNGKTLETTSVGLSFDLQICDELPTEDHDQALEFVVTETQFIPCRT